MVWEMLDDIVYDEFAAQMIYVKSITYRSFTHKIKIN